LWLLCFNGAGYKYSYLLTYLLTYYFTYFIFLGTRITGLHFAANDIDVSLFKFLWWAAKTMSFLQKWRFSRSRSSKVIDFGTNRKRECDFLLVRNNNIGPILHRFGNMAAFMCSWPHPYSTLILRVFSLHQIAHVRVSVSRDLKLCGREIIFEVF